MAHEAIALERARQLRTHQTEAEQKLWMQLRAHRFIGLKFKRQQPLGRYIVDFVCFEPKLIIELDGSQHAEHQRYDTERDAWLKTEGYTVLRFWNNQVFEEFAAILEVIRTAALGISAQPEEI
ncbi:MAG: endonuclease domain-containing protein [Burkholderiales bacterium]|nr:endonuclease domain-containing protein [Burkholderiales bacterium]